MTAEQTGTEHSPEGASASHEIRPEGAPANTPSTVDAAPHDDASHAVLEAGSEGAVGGADADDGDGAPGDEGAADGESADGGKRKRRRRRRRKGGGEESAVDGEGTATGDGAAAGGGAPAAAAGQGGRAPAGDRAASARKEAHLPFSRSFEARDGRRHAFSVGEVVAGRVVRVEHGVSVVDLFGKAVAFALENEPRDVPLPAVEPEEHEEESTHPTNGSANNGSANNGSANDGSANIGLAAAQFEGSVGMPASESLPPPSMDSVDASAVMGPGPDGVLGTDDDEPVTGESDPTRIARAAHGLRDVGTPLDDHEEHVPPTDVHEGTEESPAAEAAPEAPPLEVGQIFRGRVAAVAESGHVALHNRIVTRADARARLAAARAEHRRVWGIVYGFNRGGFDVLVEGVRAFCPVSGMSLDAVDNPEALLGRRLEFSVQQTKSGQQGIVVSRRSILERETRKRARELRKSLQPGQKLHGRVTQVRDFGIFVDIGGGVEGLVHMSEVSWDRSVRPGDVAKPGDEVEVQVLRVVEPQSRKERDGRISLSMKALAQDPWEQTVASLEEGSGRKGKVTRVAEFGAFVELVPGVEGLLHVTELGRDLKHASERIKEGEDVFVVLERIDRKARRISLSKMTEQDVKAFEEGTFESSGAAKAPRPGSMVNVKVDRVEPVGVHVQIDGITGRRGRGFIPNAEMGTERGTDHRKKFPPGMALEVKVIGLDRDGGLKLSRKGFYQDEERRAVQDYRREAASKGFGTFGDLLKNKLRKR